MTPFQKKVTCLLRIWDDIIHNDNSKSGTEKKGNKSNKEIPKNQEFPEFIKCLKTAVLKEVFL